MIYDLNIFPPTIDLETKAVLKLCASAHRYLAELKGAVQAIPNQEILVNTLALQEAKDSSAIENIITTHDDLFRGDLFSESGQNLAAREVHDYVQALRTGFGLVQKSGVISLRNVLAIQEQIEKNRAGFRKLPGTGLWNEATGELVYMPPQHPAEVERLMISLERFINVDSDSDLDPLIKMALMHHQFESIHPFYDGNGRTGRILNVLYLVQKGLLDIPILYLSRYLIQNKPDYYRLLQHVRDTGDWHTWVLYMLTAIEQTAKSTLKKVGELKDLLTTYKHGIRSQLPKLYSQDLLNNLFTHPYTKIDFIMKDLQVSRLTASNYLNALVEKGFLEKQKLGRNNYYVNVALYKLLTNGE